MKTSRWDAADHLDSEAATLAYLEAVFEDGTPDLIAAALNDVDRGLSEEALTPRIGLDAVIRTLKALGLELTAKAA